MTAAFTKGCAHLCDLSDGTEAPRLVVLLLHTLPYACCFRRAHLISLLSLITSLPPSRAKASPTMDPSNVACAQVAFFEVGT